jgi:hypothetical protein
LDCLPSKTFANEMQVSFHRDCPHPEELRAIVVFSLVIQHPAIALKAVAEDLFGEPSSTD